MNDNIADRGTLAEIAARYGAYEAACAKTRHPAEYAAVLADYHGGAAGTILDARELALAHLGHLAAVARKGGVTP